MDVIPFTRITEIERAKDVGSKIHVVWIVRVMHFRAIQRIHLRNIDRSLKRKCIIRRFDIREE
jgi:hypothetical protein